MQRTLATLNKDTSATHLDPGGDRRAPARDIDAEAAHRLDAHTHLGTITHRLETSCVTAELTEAEGRHVAVEVPDRLNAGMGSISVWP